MSRYNREVWRARRERRKAAMDPGDREAYRLEHNRKAREYRKRPHVRGKDATRFRVWSSTKGAAYWLWRQAARRARERHLAFSISVADVQAVFADCCPVFGTAWGAGRLAPSIDRLIPDRGYVPGNIVVISCRANTMKHDATAEEVEQLARWMRSQVVPL